MVVERELDASAISERLGLGDDAQAWLDELQTIGGPSEPLEPLSPDEAPALLARLAVPKEQIAEAVDVLPSLEREAALGWVLERCHHLLVRDMGKYDQGRSWPHLPPGLGAAGRYFYLWVFLATLDAVRRFHAMRGIPDDVAWATLADLGRNMAIYQRTNGVGGVGAQNWLTLHWRGALYHLGRLQYNLSRISYDASTLESLGVGFHHGDPSLGVHIPESGPMSPDACDASFRWARDFFAQFFPEHACRVATCGSWLLDEQLAEYLPQSSNIIRFQRRFHLVPGGRVCDSEIVWFVFRRVGTPLDQLPQETTLQRAIVQHLVAGRHWQSRSGWLEL